MTTLGPAQPPAALHWNPNPQPSYTNIHPGPGAVLPGRPKRPCRITLINLLAAIAVLLLAISLLIWRFGWPWTGSSKPQNYCMVWGHNNYKVFDADYSTGLVVSDKSEGDYWVVKSSDVWIQARYKAAGTSDYIACTESIAIGGPFMGNHKFLVEPKTVMVDPSTQKTRSGGIYYDGNLILNSMPSSYRNEGVYATYGSTSGWAQAAQPTGRVRLGQGIGCYTIQSIAECCKYQDGRTVAPWAGQNCIPAKDPNAPFRGAENLHDRLCEPECYIRGECAGKPSQLSKAYTCPSSSNSDLVPTVDLHLPRGIRVTIHRWDRHLDAMIAMNPESWQDGDCGNYNGNVVDDTFRYIVARMPNILSADQSDYLLLKPGPDEFKSYPVIDDSGRPSKIPRERVCEVFLRNGGNPSSMTCTGAGVTDCDAAQALCRQQDASLIIGNPRLKACMVDTCLGGSDFAKAFGRISDLISTQNQSVA